MKTTTKATITKTSNWRSLRRCIATVALLACSAAISLRAGTITVVNLPTNGTDFATGITTNKTYVSAFNFGSQNTTTYSVNGVPFAHFKSAAQNAYLSTNWVDTNPGHGGQVIVSVAVTNKGIDVTSSASQGGTSGPVASQADGNMRSILTDLMYSGNGGPTNGYLEEEFDNLTIGHQYSLRIYYRQWSSNRPQTFYFNGEGFWQAYSGNPLDEDAGGAHYLEYDFTASATNVFCLATNTVANQATMVYAATLEDDSYPYAPFVTYQPKGTLLGNTGSFTVAAIGSGTLSYQWYYNSTSNYAGATALTDGSGVSGSTSTNLTTTNNLLAYYFVVVTNNTGSATSSIVAINPNPVIVTQPSPVNVSNSYVQYSVVAGGFPTLSYHWYHNTVSNYSGATATVDGSGYSGSTNATLDASTNLADYYFVVVSNSYSVATSAITAYNPLPLVTSQPTPFKSGSSVGFNMTASGWPTLGYQWYYNTASNYSGATAMTDGGGVSGSTTPSVTVNNLLDYYFVVVSNHYGSVTSSVVLVAVPPTVLSAGEPIWNQTSQTNVVITFSDTLDSVTATTAGNYALDNGASIVSAAIGGSNEVILTTSVLNPATSYTLTVQNVNDYYGITMSPNPTNLSVGTYPAKLALWVKASADVTTDAGTNTVNEWNDLSGNNNNLFANSIVAPEPQLVTNAQGDPVIRFTGTNGTLMYANPSSTLGIVGDISIIAVVNFATLAGGTNGEIVSKTGSGSAANLPAPFDYYAIATNSSRLYRGNGSAFGQVTATSGPSLGTPHVMAVAESGNTITHFLDGQTAGTGTLNNGFNESSSGDAGQPLFIGTRGDNVNRLSGDLSELIIAGSAISSYDAGRLTTYLAQTHNITFVNTTPINVTFSSSGGNLTLSWPADHIGWTLQAQTNSTSVGISTNWVNVSNSQTTNQVVIPMAAGNQSVFYRLIYQP